MGVSRLCPSARILVDAIRVRGSELERNAVDTIVQSHLNTMSTLHGLPAHRTLDFAITKQEEAFASALRYLADRPSFLGGENAD